jgi:anaerobic selenocysteine-containing dehydrogenase
VLGANPVASNGSMWTVPDFKGKAKAMQARGGQLVVIDPRRTETAAMADTHHFIRPGADVFLLLGMVHTLFDEGLVQVARQSHMADFVTGVDDVRQAVAGFSADAVALRCGIDADAIRTLARSLANTRNASIYARIGACTQEFGSLATWLVDVLNTLTGHMDAPGGTMFPKAAAFAVNTAANTAGKPGVGRGVTTGRATSRVSGAPEVMSEFPITCLAEEIETAGEGQIKALITVATNPVLSSPNGERLSKALDQLDFMVSVDIYLNETTRHADVILPGISPLEDLHYDVAFPQLSWRNHARYSAPVFERQPGQLYEWESLLKLAAIASGKNLASSAAQIDDDSFIEDTRKQFGDNAQAVLDATEGLHGPERLLDLALRMGPYGAGFGTDSGGLTLAKVKASSATGGIDLGELQPRVPEMLRTADGKINLAQPMMLQDVKRATLDLQRPAPDMVIIGRRDVRSNNSWMHNLPILAKGPMRCTALVHPADAQRLGLVDGELTRIAATGSLNGAGKSQDRAQRSIQAQVQISADMMPGVVSLPHGWGHDLDGTGQKLAAQRPGANLNALLDENRRDPLSGNAVLSGVAVSMAALA